MKELLESYQKLMETLSAATGYISPLVCGVEQINESWLVSGNLLFLELGAGEVMSYNISESDNGILFIGKDIYDKQDIYYFVLVEDEFGTLTAFILLNEKRNTKLIDNYAER